MVSISVDTSSLPALIKIKPEQSASKYWTKI